MTKKIIIITGSALIGLIAILAIIFAMIATGSIEVEQKTIVFSSASAETVYSGETLTAKSWEITSGELREGHTANVIVSGSQTTVGTSPNTISATIVDSNGADVSDYYKIEYQPGSLKVFHRPLQILSNSATKTFDGTPLSCHSYTIASGTLPAGHSIVSEYTDSITNVGTVANNVSVSVKDANGTDVSANYNITTISGSLTVTKRPLYIQTNSATKVYDGAPLTAEGYTLLSGELIADHEITAFFSASITNAGTVSNAIYITVNAEDGTDVSNNYDVSYNVGTLTVTPINITIRTGSDEKFYDSTPLTNSIWNIEKGSLLNGDVMTVQLDSSITAIGSVPNAPIVKIKNSAGDDVTENYNVTANKGTLTVKPFGITAMSSDASKAYDGTVLKNEEFSVYNLPEGYTVTPIFTKSITNAGTVKNEFTLVIKDENGNVVTENFDVTYIYGTLTVSARPYGVISPSLSKLYDGTPLVSDGVYTLASGYTLAPEHTLHVDFTGSQSDVGTSSNSFTVHILDIDGNDVTSNYDLSSSIVGNLTVNGVTVNLTSQSAIKDYDGTPLTKSGVFYTGTENDAFGTEIVPGYTMIYRMLGTQTKAGTSENTFEITVTNSQGVDVTRNFNFICAYGTLTVRPMQITCKSDNVTEFYSDSLIECTEQMCEMVSGTLLEGHEISFIPATSSVDICETENVFYAKITDENGKDVTENYEITYLYGKFNILPYVIKVITPSASHTYDGTAFSCHEYSLEPKNALLEGHEITYIEFSPNATVTDVGTAKNEIAAIVIKNANGRYVTHNYSFDCSSVGDIIVTPRPITIRTPDAAKDYDGTPLTDERWELVSITQPLDIHLLEVAVSGTRTEPGVSENVVAEVRITERETGEYVNRNYTITLQLGALTVRGSQAPGGSTNTPSGSAGEMNEGGGLGGNGLGDDGTGNSEGEDTVFLKIHSTKSGAIYLRLKSFGDFNVSAKEWSEAIAYSELLDGKYSYNYLSGIALKNTGLSSTRIDIENFSSGQYFLPYFLDTYDSNYDIQTSDVIYTGNTEEIYSLYYYLYSGYYTGIKADLGEYADEELRYRQFVKDNYLYVDENLKAYLQKIIDQNRFDPSSATIISDVATYIQNAATYNLKYNPAIDTAAHPIIAFLVEGEGVCRHYASAATALFRTLGIPARYTIGFAGESVANTWVDITGKQAHAWVEVYIDGIGWLPIEVTGSGSSSSGSGASGIGGTGGSGEYGEPGDESNTEDEKNEFQIKPQTTYHKYDGSYADPINRLEGVTHLLAQGFTYSATVELVGDASNLPGKYETKITSFTLYDKDGQDITKNYVFNFKTGILQIYIKEITVNTLGGSKEYDGTPLKSNNYFIEETLFSGHRIKSLVCTGSQTNVGKSTNNFTISIVDENGNDVTSHYKINRKCASLTVTPATITVRANSNTKSYDGTPLVDNGYTVEGNLRGCTVEVVVVGTQTKIGYSDNIIQKVNVKDATGKDVTLNFSILCVNGKLYVTPPVN